MLFFVCNLFKSFFELSDLSFYFFSQLFGMIQLMCCILFAPHLPNLYQGSHQEYSTNYPIEDILVVANLISNDLAAENKDKVANKSSNTYPNYVNVIMVITR